MEDQGSLISVIALALSVIAVLVSVRSFDLDRQANYKATLIQSVYGEFSDRRLKSRESIEIQGEAVEYLRRAQWIARDERARDTAAWSLASRVESYPSWQNVIAYETAQALEDTGSAVFFGLIPLELVLPFVADSMIDNWLICKDWVRSYRAKNEIYCAGDLSLPYHRIHAEWVAIVAALWMNRKYSGAGGEEVLADYGGEVGAKRRLSLISTKAAVALPWGVRVDLWRHVKLFPIVADE